MTIQWNSSLVLGIESMDLTHREFVDQLIAFEAVADPELRTRFADIMAHTEGHFRREDEWMRQLAFPQAEEHMDEHDKVLKVMEAVWQCVEKGDTRFGRILIREIAHWFGEHALTMDAALADFLHANGHAPGGPGISADTAGR